MKINKKFFLLFAILCFCALNCLCSCSKQKVIDLNKYVSIVYEGKNGGGTANYVFDFEKFEKNYAGKIKMTDNAKIAGINDLEKSVARLLIDTCVVISVDSDEEYLSNGDTVRLSWDCNEATALDYFNCKLSYKDVEDQTSGLEEPDEIDPFEYSYLVTSFYSPFIDASLVPVGKNPLAYSISFSLNKSNKLKTGEVVKATANYAEGEKKFIHDFGCRFSRTEKEYTIESTARFVSTVDEVQSSFKPASWTDFYWEPQKFGKKKVFLDYTIDYEHAELYITTNDFIDKEPKSHAGGIKAGEYHSVLAIYRHYKCIEKGKEYWNVKYLCNYYIDENGEWGHLTRNDNGAASKAAGYSSDDYDSFEGTQAHVAEEMKNYGFVLYEESR